MPQYEMTPRELEAGHFERIRARCECRYHNEKGPVRLNRYTVGSDDRLTLLLNDKNGTFTELVKRDGSFAGFPGVEYSEELIRALDGSTFEERVEYGAYIEKMSDGTYLFLWTVLPYRFDPGDEWGFGMESEAEIVLYSRIGTDGGFTAPFRLYSVGNQGYSNEPEDEIKAIFLDIDGVLNSRRYLRDRVPGFAIDPSRLEILRRIVYETDAAIVLTSSWRRHWNVFPSLCGDTGNVINLIFSKAGLYVHDKTPELNGDRYEEIAAWLKAHPNVRDFAVIDDFPFEEGILRGRFVLTSDLRGGLGEEDAEKAIAILGQKTDRDHGPVPGI